MNRYALLLILVLGLAIGVGFVISGFGTANLSSTDLTNPDLSKTGGKEIGSSGFSAKSSDTTGSPKREVFDDSVRGGAGEPAAYQKALSGLRGRLVWASSGEPISGVEVKLGEAWLDAVVPKVEDIAGLAEMRSPLVFRASGRSNENGVFLLKGVHSRAILFLAFGLQTDTAGFRFIDRSPRPGELLDLGDILVLERGTVTGRVLDDSGQPVVGARVRVVDIPKIAFQFGAERVDAEGMVLWVQGSYRIVMQIPKWVKQYDEIAPFGNAYTKQDGSFEVTGVRPGSPNLIVTKPELAPIQRSISVTSLEQTDIGSLSMGEGEVILGKFVDGNDDPVTTVSVAAGGGNGIVPVAFINKPKPVDSKGEFEITGLPRNQLFLVYQRKVGLPWEVSGPHRGDDEVKIVLGTMAEGMVRVVEGSTQKPYKGPIEFSVCISDESVFMSGFEKMIPGKNHFFRSAEKKHEWAVRDLPEGIYRVIARAEGYGLASGVLDLGRKSKNRTTQLNLVAAPRLRFEVVSKKGRPVEAARIYWNPAPKRDERKRKDMTGMPIIVGKTDAEGVLEASTIPLGATRFYARHPAFALASQKEIPSSRTIRFVLGPTGSVEGLVAEDGQPPNEELTVVAAPLGSLREEFAGVILPSFTTPGPDGSFRIANLQPGTWRLRAIPSFGKIATPAQMQSMAASSGSRAPSRDIEVVANGEGFVRLEVRSESSVKGSGSIIGSVYVGGEPAEGAWVQTWAGQRRAEVSKDGSFELRGLQDGDLWIGVERAGTNGLLPNRLWEGRITIANGAQETLQIDVQAGDVEIEVIDVLGKPVTSLPLTITGTPVDRAGHRGQARISVMTNAGGRALFSAVPHGDYTLRSAMQRNASAVLPNVKLSVFSARVDYQVTAILPVRAAGIIRFDESELTEPAEREWARQRRPNYLVFDHERRFIWGSVTQKDGIYRFQMRPGPPGNYRLMPRGKLRWTSSVLHVPAEGIENAQITLRPDAEQVRAVFAKQKPAKGPGQGK